MGIAKYLKAGRIKIDAIEKKINIGEKPLVLSYNQLKDTDWGYVYEKYVGQILEDEGYDVKFNGLEFGFLDRGIDLIASKDNCIYFIQCKFSKGLISKSQIEWIFYKASRKLYENYKQHHKNIYFVLIVNNIDANFSQKKSKKFQLTFSDMSKVKYPILQYFLDHNHIQDKVKLQVREIEMIR